MVAANKVVAVSKAAAVDKAVAKVAAVSKVRAVRVRAVVVNRAGAEVANSGACAIQY